MRAVTRMSAAWRSTPPSSRRMTSAASTASRSTPTSRCAIGRAFARVLARARGQARRRAAGGARPRHAPDRARARGALPRGPADEGAARARRRPGGHRDALLPRRLARAGRRADVHRLAQPQGLHGRQARARRRDRAVGRRRHPGHPPRHRDRCGPPHARPRRTPAHGPSGTVQEVDVYEEFQAAALAIDRPRRRCGR